MPEALAVFDPGERLIPVEFWHFDVEEHNVERGGIGTIEPAERLETALGRLGLVPLGLEPLGQSQGAPGRRLAVRPTRGRAGAAWAAAVPATAYAQARREQRSEVGRVQRWERVLLRSAPTCFKPPPMRLLTRADVRS